MKLGFLLSYLGHSQLGFHIINSGNELLAKWPNIDVVAFISNPVKPMLDPAFAVMNINEAFDYDGIVFATDLYTAEKLSRFPGPRLKYFYLWDLEWMRNPGRSFEELKSIYTDPRIEIIARSNDHADCFFQCWNRRPYAVVPNCDIPGLVEMVDVHAEK
jgi:hypothetical protein